MRVSDCIGCETFPCRDVREECYLVPDVEVNPEQVSLMMISEAAPADSADYYYATGNPLFQQTTLQAFKEADADVSSFQDVNSLRLIPTRIGVPSYQVRLAITDRPGQTQANQPRA